MAKKIKPVPTKAEQFITAEEKKIALMARDIMFIKEDLYQNRYDFLIEIMSGGGDGWTQYANLTSESLNWEFNQLVEQFHEDDLDLMNNHRYVSYLDYLWHLLLYGRKKKGLID